MSGRRPPITFASDARADLRAILLYTRRTWGPAQRERYAAQFRRAFDDLRTFPELGFPRDDFFDGCRACLVQHHMIYFLLLPESIHIVRILHKSEDAAAKSGEPAPLWG